MATKKKIHNAAVQMFADKGADKIYSALVKKARAQIGARAMVEDPKQTCMHLVATASGTAFAGIHPRKSAVLLNIRLDAPLKSKRVRKLEQASRNRYHCEMLLASEAEVDDELIEWIEAAHQLASGK